MHEAHEAWRPRAAHFDGERMTHSPIHDQRPKRREEGLSFLHRLILSGSLLLLLIPFGFGVGFGGILIGTMALGGCVGGHEEWLTIGLFAWVGVLIVSGVTPCVVLLSGVRTRWVILAGVLSSLLSAGWYGAWWGLLRWAASQCT